MFDKILNMILIGFQIKMFLFKINLNIKGNR